MKIFFTVLIIAVSFLTIYPQDTIHIPGDYATIQLGIDAASNGDIVLVEDGTYMENINYRGKAITVASRFLVDGDTNHINNTIIDGSQPVYPDTGSVVTFNSGEDTNSVLCGFTITGGTGTFFPAGSPPAPPYPIRSGGGIQCYMSGAKIVQNKIISNECIIDITDGQATGGGICAPPDADSYVIIEINKIINNTAWSKGTATSSSRAWAVGGGVAIYLDGSIKYNELLSNLCKSDHGTSAGGGIYLIDGLIDIDSNKVFQNESVSIESYGFGGGICCAAAISNITLNRISNNSVSAGGSYSCGAGIYFDQYYSVVENNIIVNNTAMSTNGYGGGIGLHTSSPQIINNILIKNSANYGGALDLFNGCKPVLINNTIAFNNANHSGGAIYSEDPTTNPININTIMWNDIASVSGNEIDLFNGGNVTARYCDITGGWTGEGNIDADPFFVDTIYNLADSSMCIGAGIDSIEVNGTWYYAPPFDYDGDPRPNPPECMPDIGAQESPLCNPATTVSIDPTELFFSGVLVNEDSTMLFTITNTGNIDLEVMNITSSEPAFAVNITTATIPPGGAQDVEVTFAPTSTESYAGIIEISHSAIGSPDSVNVSGNGITGIDDKLINTIPDNFIVYQNYPNPFNPKTTILFGLPEAGEVKLTLFNSLGEEVTNLFAGYKNAGYHQVEFDATELPSGVYFYRFQVVDPSSGSGQVFVETKKMLLLK